MVVDYQTHWLPPAGLELLAGREQFPRVRHHDGGYLIELAPGRPFPLPPAHTDLDAQLGAADEAGIDVLVSSPNLLGEVLDLPSEEATELLMAINAIVADAQREHRGRFVGLAMLPMQDAAAAVRVLDDAHRLGLSGVCMLPTIAGEAIATKETLPVFERMEELGVPLFLHPELRFSSASMALSPRAEVGIGWMFSTALAALNLIDSGTLDRCPRLVVLHPHVGGVLPWVHGRVSRLFPPEGQAAISDYLRSRFYTDSVSGTPGALGFAVELYGADRVLFATDYPYVPMAAGRGYVEAEDGDAIYANRLPGLELGG